MKTKNKIHLNCGYEDKCLHKECLKCPRMQWHELHLSLAEKIAIEDFAVCDLKALIEEKPKTVALLQDIMRKLMMKAYKDEDKIEKKAEKRLK